MRVRIRFNGPGVYQWKNKINGKVYIGSAINLWRRKLEHIARLTKHTENSEHFQRAWDKYSAENFEFSIIERCSAEQRLEREQYWIDRFDATDERFGYNLIPTRKSQLYGKALSKYQKAGWAKYTAEERKKLNLHLNEPAAKAIALAKSNEVKKLQSWRDSMSPVWSRLQSRWDNPIEAAKMRAAQNEGRKRAKLRREALKSTKNLISDEIVRPTIK